MERVQLIIYDFKFATELMISLFLSCRCWAYCRTGPTGFQPRSPDASLSQQLLSRLRGNASYLDYNRKCQRKFGCGRPWLFKAHLSTWRHPNTTATRLSTRIYMHVCVCVCLKGEFVCERECLHITQHFFFPFFLISRIGPGFCLGQRRQRERWCSVLCCYCLSHTDAHTHTHLNTHTHWCLFF